MSLTVLVIDTSYLLELYGVPSKSSPEARQKVKVRFARAAVERNRLYVPFPVVFEVANHIAHSRSRALAQLFVDDVLQSLEKSTRFIITPVLNAESLKLLLQVFSNEHAHQGIGLTDGSVIEEARRLKKNYGAAARVHIWTKDASLKAHEPDGEQEPFVV